MASEMDKKDESGTAHHDEVAFNDEKKVNSLVAIDSSNLDYSGAVITLSSVEKALVRKLDWRIMVSERDHTKSPQIPLY